MGDRSKIEWTEATWNPVTGCSPVSEGCENCYAKRKAEGRLRGRCGYDRDDPFKVAFHPERLGQPSQWSKPRRIFVCSMGDLFHEDVEDEWLNRVFLAMAVSARHTYIVLTKRPERMRAFLLGKIPFVKDAGVAGPGLFPHVWLGVTAENQARADERIPVLLDTPAAVRFVSVEPMLGPVDILDPLFAEGKAGSPHLDVLDARNLGMPSLDWVICGGETGREARPMHPDWARGLRDQCLFAGVPFFFKQWGEWAAVHDRDKEDPDCRSCDLVVSRSPKGRWMNLSGGHGFHGERVVRIDRLGKKAAGRILDGKVYDEIPEDGGKTRG